MDRRVCGGRSFTALRLLTDIWPGGWVVGWSAMEVDDGKGQPESLSSFLSENRIIWLGFVCVWLSPRHDAVRAIRSVRSDGIISRWPTITARMQNQGSRLQGIQSRDYNMKWSKQHNFILWWWGRRNTLFEKIWWGFKGLHIFYRKVYCGRSREFQETPFRYTKCDDYHRRVM